MFKALTTSLTTTLALLCATVLLISPAWAREGIVPVPTGPGHVAIVTMNMMILPGTGSYLERSINLAASRGAKLVVVKLDTPGGMLQTSQEMVQTILTAPVPVVVYVSPSGGSATSAGVFITLAAHVAAMAPGTTIGAAHPVAGDGKDIEGDLRTKAENITVAMVKTISEQRGRNATWAEKAVKESSSLTEKEAVELQVVDFIAEDLDVLLQKVAGKTVTVANQQISLEDYSQLPREEIEIAMRERAVNVLANPAVAALLWLGATTGLTLELYNPGAILPGVVGVICLILALVVTQIIPLNQGGILLIVAGALLMGLELFVPSGILAVGGLIAMTLGVLYLVDSGAVPGLDVQMTELIPVVVIVGVLFLALTRLLVRANQQKPQVGLQGLVGRTGTATQTIGESGQVFVNGELWRARTTSGVIPKGAQVVVTGYASGLTLEVEPLQEETPREKMRGDT